MADDSRAPADPLAASAVLGAEPYAIDFFQALRRIECQFRAQPRIGEAPRPGQEPVRLGQEPSLAFEASTIKSLATNAEGQPLRLLVSFFGIMGANGPLPLHLTEYIRQRQRHGHDPTLSHFLDIFHHRMLALFYRAWANARPTVSHDRTATDRFRRYVGSSIGLGLRAPADENRLDDFKLYMARHLTGHTRHPEGLCKLISTFFSVPARIEEFIGVWLDVPPAFQWKLGGQEKANGQRLGTLGTSTRVGRRIWDCQQKFRIALGPLNEAQYHRLMPEGEDLPRLVSLVRSYIGEELDWDVRLILREADMQPTRLGRTGRLGRSTYLLRQQTATIEQYRDLIIDPLARASTSRPAA